MARFPITRKEFRRWLLEKRDTKSPISKSLITGTCPLCPLALAILEVKKRDASLGYMYWSYSIEKPREYPIWAKRFIRKIDQVRSLRNEDWSDIPPLLALQVLDSTSKGPTS